MIKILIIKLLIAVLFTFCFLFASCINPDTDSDNGTLPDDSVENNPGAVKGLSFSHKSGLYSSSFNLTLTAGTGATIYYSIDGSIPDPDNLVAGRTFQYTAPITVKNRNGESNLLATQYNSERFYGFPNDPRGNMPAAYFPTDEQVPKATVIRAISISSSGDESAVATLTYFIGDNLSGYGSHPIISLVTDPKNLVDETIGIMVRGSNDKTWSGSGGGESNPMMYNFRQRGAEWERETAFTFFDSSKNPVIADNVAIRVRGGWSRAQGQKSMNIYFRGEYGGINRLDNYELIPGAKKADGNPLKTTKSFMVRNGGNDCESTKFRDVYIQRLVNDRNFTTQSAVPCVVYLNGEYWGPYNLQERYSDNHTEYVFGVSRNDVISVENNEVDDGVSFYSKSEWESEMDSFATGVMDASKLTEFKTKFDYQNYLDYWATEIYIYNADWPQNNFRMWKTRTTNSNPYNDGKWRYQLLDTELSMGIYDSGSLLTSQQNDSLANTFDRIINGKNKDHVNSRLFKNLLTNTDFCKDFVNTMMDLYNVNFNPDIAFPKLDEIANIYSSLLDGAKTRWGYDPNISGNVGQMKSYMQSIRYAMPGYLKEYAQAGDITNVTLSAKHSNIVMNNLSMKINTVSPTVSGGTWTGQYFQNGSITVTTNDISGYAFENWTVTGGIITSGNGTKTITVTLTALNAEITANYSSTTPITNVQSVGLNKQTMNLTTGNSEKLTATVSPPNATYKTVTWSSNNPQAATVDQNGNVTAIAAVNGGNSATKATITATTADGNKIATCIVTVNPALQEGGWGVSRPEWAEFNFIVGDTYKFISWMNSTVNRNITFSSSNSSVASVSSDGTITAISNGDAVITCTAVDGNYTKTFNVNVRSGQKLFDLSEVLKDQATQVIDTQTKFNAVFAGSPLQPGGGVGNHVIFEIVIEDGLKRLKVTSLPTNWSAGIDLNHNLFSFQPGDIIDIRGKYRSGDGVEGEMCMNMYHMGEALLWHNGYNLGNYWDFETSVAILQHDIDTLLTNTEDQPPSIRIRAKDPGRTFHIEHIRVYRFTN